MILRLRTSECSLNLSSGQRPDILQQPIVKTSLQCWTWSEMRMMMMLMASPGISLEHELGQWLLHYHWLLQPAISHYHWLLQPVIRRRNLRSGNVLGCEKHMGMCAEILHVHGRAWLCTCLSNERIESMAVCCSVTRRAIAIMWRFACCTLTTLRTCTT